MMRRLATGLMVSAVLGMAMAQAQSPASEPVTVIVDPEGDQEGAPVNGVYDLASVTWSKAQGLFEIAMGRNPVSADPRDPMGPPAENFRLHFTVDGQAFELTPTSVAASLPPFYQFRLDRQALGGNGSLRIEGLWAESLRDDPLAGLVQEDRAPDAGFGEDVVWTGEPDDFADEGSPHGNATQEAGGQATVAPSQGRPTPGLAFVAVLALMVALSLRPR